VLWVVGWLERLVRRGVSWGASFLLLWWAFLHSWSTPIDAESTMWPLFVAMGLGFVLLTLLDRRWGSLPKVGDAQGRALGRRWVRSEGRVFWAVRGDEIPASIPFRDTMEVPLVRPWVVLAGLSVLSAVPVVWAGDVPDYWVDGVVKVFLLHGILGSIVAAGLGASLMVGLELVRMVRRARTHDDVRLPASQPIALRGFAALLALGTVVMAPALMLVFSSPLWAVIWGLAPGVVLLVAALFVRPRAVGSSEPTTASGRVFWNDWVERGGEVQWVTRKDAQRARQHPRGPDVDWTVSGFELRVPPGNAPLPLAWLVRWVLGFASLPMVGLIAVFLAAMLLLSPSAVMDSAYLGFLGVVAWCGVVVVPLLAWAAGFAVTAAGVKAWLHRTTGSRVQRVGRLLRTDQGTFTMGLEGQTASLSWGWRGASLHLRNDRESLTLVGRHAELVWLAEQVRGVPQQGAEQDVPQALRNVAQRAVTT
jgi:hypothetical protein